MVQDKVRTSRFGERSAGLVALGLQRRAGAKKATDQPVLLLLAPTTTYQPVLMEALMPEMRRKAKTKRKSRHAKAKHDEPWGGNVA